MGKKKREHKKEQKESKCESKSCVNCKQAYICGSKIFCGWLRKIVEEHDDGIEIFVCPHFEVESLEYKLYRRT